LTACRIERIERKKGPTVIPLADDMEEHPVVSIKQEESEGQMLKL
jgi:hypothetical protein